MQQCAVCNNMLDISTSWANSCTCSEMSLSCQAIYKLLLSWCVHCLFATVSSHKCDKPLAVQGVLANSSADTSEADYCASASDSTSHHIPTQTHTDQQTAPACSYEKFAKVPAKTGVCVKKVAAHSQVCPVTAHLACRDTALCAHGTHHAMHFKFKQVQTCTQ